MLLNYWWQLLICFLGVYLYSNINFAIILAKRFKHQDIRQMGSGNPGTTNMLRSYGVTMGGLTFLLDCLKGVAAGLIGLFVFRALSDSEAVVLLAQCILGLAAVLGHVFPVFIGFKGGKGFATGVGFFAVINPIFTAIAVVAVIIVVLFFDFMSLGAILFFTSQLTYSLIKFFGISALTASVDFWWIVGVLILIWAIIMWAHRANIKRLLTLSENRSNFKKLFNKRKRAALNAVQGGNVKSEEEPSEDVGKDLSN